MRTGWVMIRSEATIEDVVRMNTRTRTFGCELAGTGTPAKLHPGVLRALRPPSQARRIRQPR